METRAFVKLMNDLLEKARIDDCISCMKYLHVNITIADARLLLKSAYKYTTIVGDLPFPKEIGGVMYESVGDYVVSRLTEDQVKSINQSPYLNFTIQR